VVAPTKKNAGAGGKRTIVLMRELEDSLRPGTEIQRGLGKRCVGKRFRAGDVGKKQAENQTGTSRLADGWKFQARGRGEERGQIPKEGAKSRNL